MLTQPKKRRYSKVVLARTARLRFAVPLSPPDVLARFRGHYGFLFCLQVIIPVGPVLHGWDECLEQQQSRVVKAPTVLEQ